MVFWQSPRTRKQARPQVRTPTARPAALDGTGTDEIEIVVDAHERYPYRFASQQTRTVRRALPAGDYGVVLGDIARGLGRAQVAARPDLERRRTGACASRWASSPRSPVPRSWSRTAGPRCSRNAGCARPRWPTRWPSCRSGGRTSRSSSPRRGRWPRSGPSATWRAALAWAHDEHAVGARAAGRHHGADGDHGPRALDRGGPGLGPTRRDRGPTGPAAPEVGRGSARRTGPCPGDRIGPRRLRRGRALAGRSRGAAGCGCPASSASVHAGSHAQRAAGVIVGAFLTVTSAWPPR